MHYAFTVKRNQKTLYQWFCTLPWSEVTAVFCDRSRGHGRTETRVIKVLTVTELGVNFPHAAQASRIVLRRTNTKPGKRSRETVYVVTDLTSRQASLERLTKIACLHWGIENRLHSVRETAFRELG